MRWWKSMGPPNSWPEALILLGLYRRRFGKTSVDKWCAMTKSDFLRKADGQSGRGQFDHPKEGGGGGGLLASAPPTFIGGQPTAVGE